MTRIKQKAFAFQYQIEFDFQFQKILNTEFFKDIFPWSFYEVKYSDAAK